jgi:VNT family MFS transporter (synaptic vesicle glycoprotein 2)
MLMSWFYEIAGISYYLPVAECDLGITSKLDYGIINGFAYAGLVLSYYLWGVIGDTKGRRKVLIPTLFMGFFISVLASFTSSFWMFAVLRFLNGFL